MRLYCIFLRIKYIFGSDSDQCFFFIVLRSKSISFGNSVSPVVVQPDSQPKNGFLLQNLLPGTHLFCVYGDNWFQSVRYSCNTLTFAAPSLLGTLSGAWWRFRRTPTALQRSRPQRRNWQTRKRSLKFSRFYRRAKMLKKNTFTFVL